MGRGKVAEACVGQRRAGDGFKGMPGGRRERKGAEIRRLGMERSTGRHNARARRNLSPLVCWKNDDFELGPGWRAKGAPPGGSEEPTRTCSDTTSPEWISTGARTARAVSGWPLSSALKDCCCYHYYIHFDSTPKHLSATQPRSIVPKTGNETNSKRTENEGSWGLACGRLDKLAAPTHLRILRTPVKAGQTWNPTVTPFPRKAISPPVSLSELSMIASSYTNSGFGAILLKAKLCDHWGSFHQSTS